MEEENIKSILVDFTPKISKQRSKTRNTSTTNDDSSQSKRSWIANVQLNYDPKNRVIVDTKRWNRVVSQDTDIDSPISVQMSYLVAESNLVKEQINTKIKGYRYQDLLKGLYKEDEFVDYPYVIDLLRACELKCFYCHLECMILYPYVREPRQWTLERIQNHIGHNKGNVQIACLDCNLRRRTIHHERYLDTKKIAKVRKITSEEELYCDFGYEDR
jgi:hypothetical protein